MCGCPKFIQSGNGNPGMNVKKKCVREDADVRGVDSVWKAAEV